ncbi:MAG: NfeD family protein [Firmicutes bacterium]|nr:NfeD family protein [Bacillota bacterium]
MTLATIFTILLGVGAGYTVIAFLLGEFLGHTDVDIANISPLKPTVIAAFITVFGGAGLVLLQFVNEITALPLAGLIALAIATVIYRFIIVPLTKAQNTTVVAQQTLIGCQAEVTEKIPQGNYGKITYKVKDNIYTAPAKSEDGTEIARNSRVEIVHIEKNTYYVRVF